MSTKKHILVVGLAKPPQVGPEHVRAAAGSEEDLKRKIMTSMQQAKDAGYEVEVNQIHPEEFPQGIAQTREKLRSRKWDAYVVGFGIRGVPEFTDAFEKLVNAGRELAPETPMVFNTRPDDLMEPLQRMSNNV